MDNILLENNSNILLENSSGILLLENQSEQTTNEFSTFISPFMPDFIPAFNSVWG